MYRALSTVIFSHPLILGLHEFHRSSLDRTNVVQSTLAKWALTQQLRQAGVLGTNETLDQHPDFIFMFRNGKFRTCFV